MTWTTHHTCLDIRGAIRNGKKFLWTGMFLHDDGRKMNAAEAMETLLDELSKGRKVLPVGEPCEGFSYDTGCPGHQT